MSDLNITKKEKQLLDYIKEHNISLDAAKEMLVNKPIQYSSHNINISDKHVKFGALTDTHMGHKNYRPDIMDYAAKIFKKEKVEFVTHSGDICEGVSGRDGHTFELSHLSATDQMNYAVKELSKIEQEIYAITATNSHDGWFSCKGNIGFEVGYELQNKLNNFNFLGYDEADIKLANKVTIRLSHPGGGTAYAISYAMQKYCNSLSGIKPNLILQGHYHKAQYLFYRNMHCFDVGCLEDQTIFMKKKQTPAMLGFWIIDVYAGSKGGVHKLKTEFYPFYEKNK